MESKEPDIIKETIDFFHNYYGTELSPEDAKEAVQNISGFFRILQEWEKKGS